MHNKTNSNKNKERQKQNTTKQSSVFRNKKFISATTYFISPGSVYTLNSET